MIKSKFNDHYERDGSKIGIFNIFKNRFGFIQDFQILRIFTKVSEKNFPLWIKKKKTQQKSFNQKNSKDFFLISPQSSFS